MTKFVEIIFNFFSTSFFLCWIFFNGKMYKNMIINLRKFLTFIFVFLFAIECFATHNRAGEIVYEHISGYTYKIIVYTYCYTGTQADRNALEVDCGDGKTITVERISQVLLSKDLRKNIYTGTHTYSGPGTYVLYMEDPNRNEGVKNIPNSVNVVFSIKTVLSVSAFVGHNSSPILLNSPMDKGAINRVFVHNPGAYDPDGDSLSYKIAICMRENATEIEGYSFPPVSDSIYVDPITGDYVWDKPTQVGFYNIAMEIEEWRSGVKIGSVLRDIQVEIIDSDNKTPEIEDLSNYCVFAGEQVKFSVRAHDPDPRDNVNLSATGGVFVVDYSPADFVVPNNNKNDVTGYFSWQTHVSHIRRQPYDVLVKAVDDDDIVPLTAYKTSKIRVIAPAPEVLTVQPTNSTISVMWNSGGNYTASGFKVYRIMADDKYESGACETGLPESSGYELIKTLEGINDTVFVDDNDGVGLKNGFRYCYRVTAYFADGVESIVSNRKCAVLPRTTIMFTKATVNSTDENTGEIHLEWTPPEEFDQTAVPPPYAYILEAAHGIRDGVFTNPIYFDKSLDDTVYTEKNVDTKNKGGIYKLAFANYENNGWKGMGASAQTSTVFISAEPGSRKITITHDAIVPWENDTFIIYRKDAENADFDSVGWTKKGTYTDYNLENGKTYYYKMKTIGYYSAEGLPTHIENWSQEVSAIPIDTVAPCVDYSVKSNCDDVYNLITWGLDSVCGENDVLKYTLYYSETIDGPLEELEDFEPNIYEYKHFPTRGMAGCYVVAAEDSTGNKTVGQAKACVDMCEYYRLPNVFTPNADGKNDLYHPYPYQFVDHVDMTITNRWGKVVFKTNDPDLNWDGTDIDTGKPLPDGVYYYRCTVYEYRLTGIEDREMDGYITIFSKKIDK